MRLLDLLVVLTICFVCNFSQGVKVKTREDAIELLKELKDRHVREVFKQSKEARQLHKEHLIKILNKKIKQSKRFDLRSYNSGGNGGAEIDNAASVAPYSPLASLLGSMVVQHTNRFGHAAEPHSPAEMDSIHRQKSQMDGLDGHKLTHNQAVELGTESEYVGENSNKKRNFLTDTSILWPQGIIPYEIDSSLSNDQNYVKIIEDSVAMFTNLTCLKWVKRNDPLVQGLGHSSYIQFFSERGCWSYVGRVFNDRQQISLQAPWCVTVPITIHEMCHAIGQMHEQSRTDRDNYVTMLWQNIRGGQGNNNMAKSSTLDNNPYDYESVLQYGLYSFSSNGQPSMEFKDRRLDFLADSATGLMFYDIQDVVDAYKCADHCSPKPTCQYGGFVNHKCTCFCPSGLTGNFCERTTSTQPVCGRDIITVFPGRKETILSPNYPNFYPLNTECVWLIKVPVGKLVKMTINDLHLSDSGNACYHWLEIQYNLIGQTGPRRCGFINTGISYTTTLDGNSNLMMLKFDSAFAADKAATKGFNLTVEAVGLGCLQNKCKFGTCVESDTNDYTCNCRPGWQGKYCDTPDASMTLTCDFEPNSFCFMANVKGSDIFNWISRTGPTPSKGTGPSSAKDGTHYIYAEMSAPRQQGDTARYELDIGYPSPSDRCLRFWYHMFGSTVDTLKVYTTSQSSNQQILWSMSQEQGDRWIEASVDIRIMPNVKFGFEATRGSSWNSDIAIDVITFSPGACSSTVTSGPNSTFQPSTPSPPNPCSPNPCLNGGTCSYQPGSNTYVCQCMPKWSGINCETCITTPIPDPCSSLPCLNGGTCMSQGTAFSCICDINWTGMFCETSNVISTPGPDPCLSNPCMNGGTCISQSGTFYCACDINWTGFYCEISLTNTSPVPDPCLSNPCMNGGTCISQSGTFYCACDINWTGFYCEISLTNTSPVPDPCLSNPCMNGGTCISQSGTFYCACDINWTGFYCEISLTNTSPVPDPCLSNPCMNGGTCISQSGTFYCACDINWTGFYCEISLTNTSPVPDPCLSNPCMNGGTCIFQSGTFYCACDINWTGFYCEISLTNTSPVPDPCLSNPCMNGGTCISQSGTFYCACDINWTGYYCEISLIYTSPVPDLCQPNPCLNNGTCYIDPISTVGFSCACYARWTGVHCETMLGQGNLTCTVEMSDPCFLQTVVGKDFTWTLQKGRTPSRGTGPDRAYEGDYYFYIETSSPRRKGEEAWLESSILTPNVEQCLTFYYHAYGANIGSLDVLYDVGQGPYTIWTINTDNGKQWHGVSLQLQAHPWSKIYFRGVVGNSYRGDVAIDNIDISTGLCNNIILPPTLSPHNMKCTFEHGTSCFLHNVRKDDFDWKKHEGGTPSRKTGPTSAYEGRFYMYMEASYKDANEFAVLQSGVLPREYMCMHFEYFMYGQNMGALEVLQGNRTFSTPLFFEDTDLGSQWNHAAVELTPMNNSNVSFIGSVGSGYQSDIALDDIQVTPGHCGCASNPCKNGGSCIPTPSLVHGDRQYSCTCQPQYTDEDCSVLVGGTVKCGFETDTCFFDQSSQDDFDWTRRSGSTPSSGTGPSSAKEGQYYMYIETSSPRRPDQTAMLETNVDMIGDNCMTFQYHMYGNNIRELKIEQNDVLQGRHTIWRESGPQGNNWHKGFVQLSSTSPYTVSITASRGSSYKGDIAIDDVEIKDGFCGCASNPCQNGGQCTEDAVGGVSCQCRAGYTGPFCETIAGGYNHCDFSDDSCFLKNVNDDDFNWSAGVSTPSHGTGPQTPHDGKFAYIEASSPRRSGDEAVASSLGTTLDPGPQCLEFYYNMYGRAMGDLEVWSGPDSSESNVWSENGNHGKNWNFAQVDIPAAHNKVIKIVGIRGSSYTSDIAVDDISLLPGPCV